MSHTCIKEVLVKFAIALVFSFAGVGVAFAKASAPGKVRPNLSLQRNAFGSR